MAAMCSGNSNQISGHKATWPSEMAATASQPCDKQIDRFSKNFESLVIIIPIVAVEISKVWSRSTGVMPSANRRCNRRA
jgi:hypothetical protein